MTKIFKQAKIAGAVAAAMMTGLATTSVQAVNLSTTGLGEVALVPYYSVRNGYDTYISIVNTDPVNVIAVKIRFREHDNSRDARDFLIYLSPNDVWTGTVTMHAAVDDSGAPIVDAAGNPAPGWPVVQTNDTSCTVPALIPYGAAAIPGSPAGVTQATMPGMKGVAFTSADYDGTGTTPADGGSGSIVRTYDGYVEIIQMGRADPALSPIAALAVHAGGAPLSCSTLEAQYAGGTVNPGLPPQFGEPSDVMKVAANLINSTTGLVVPMPVTMLANFNNTNDMMKFEPGNTAPNLSNALPTEIVKINSVGTLQNDKFNLGVRPEPGVDSVSALLMATSVINEYAIGGASLALNDWVLTFPTKHHYTDAVVAALPPFSNLYGAGGACDSVKYTYANREELSELENVPFSPPLPNQGICKEVNILAFAVDVNNVYSVLAGNISNTTPPPANNVYGINLAPGFTSGWLKLNFNSLDAAAGFNGANVTTGALTNYQGLPVIGFGIKTYTNVTTHIQYGITQEHAYTRNP